jgi:endogenous inhibitor of DNA gyrase (YacG/DUF329 family)
MSTSAPAKCPLCRQPSVAAHAPFCSPACQDRDLLNWLGEAYAVPGPPADPDADFGETPLDKA